MTKENVMIFLDKNKGIFFKVDDIRNGMIEINMPVPTRENTYKSLRGIIKRKEYEVFIVVNSSGHKVKLYRRK